jgi:hypothetical protein
MRAIKNISIIASCIQIISLMGCSDSSERGEPAVTPAACAPTQQGWDKNVSHAMEHACSQCHGERPSFGAPFALTDYDALIAGKEGERLVDRIAQSIHSGRMPPASANASQDDLATILSWASCGTLERAPDSGLTVDRPVFVPAPAAPAGSTPLDITADKFAVGEDVRDRYEHFFFSNLVSSDRFIRRLEGAIDADEVIHHLILSRQSASGSFEYLYTWAPGTGAVDFPDGGVRLRPQDKLRLEIHYNNGQSLPDIKDSSGVRVWLSEPGGTEYTMIGPGPGASNFSIPARSSAIIESSCEVAHDVKLYAVMPHMHEIGEGMEVLAKGGMGTRSITTLERWDFHTQRFYALSGELKADEELTVRCRFDNPTAKDVVAGEATTDEMCFAFIYVTPPIDNICKTNGLRYTPGACSTSRASAPTVVASHISDVEAPMFEATAALPAGRWVISGARVSSAEMLIRSATFSVAGQLKAEGSAVELDAAFHIVSPIQPEGEQTDLSFAGTLASAPGPLTTSCGDASAAEAFTFGVIGGKPAVSYKIPGPITATLWLELSAAP